MTSGNHTEIREGADPLASLPQTHSGSGRYRPLDETTPGTSLLNIGRLERDATQLHHEFRSAAPFPHVVIDDVLRLPLPAISAFPDSSWSRWNEINDGYIHNKRFCQEIDRIPEPFKRLVQELNEPRFLHVVEQITGIRQLIPDPYLFGGGIHLSGSGGVLSPHTDFHYHRFLNLYRRVNVIVYLNEDWSLQDGGCLSFYDANGRPTETVVPHWGTAVIFRTDDKSVHGYTDPIVDGRWRRSVALFYYTSAPAKDFSGDDTTHYTEHGQHRGVSRKARMLIYHFLMNVSCRISVMAHILNPNMGMPAVKAFLEYRRKTQRERAEATAASLNSEH